MTNPFEESEASIDQRMDRFEARLFAMLSQKHEASVTETEKQFTNSNTRERFHISSRGGFISLKRMYD